MKNKTTKTQTNFTIATKTLLVIIGTISATLLVTACGSVPKFQGIEKEANNPQPKRYEAPYYETRDQPSEGAGVRKAEAIEEFPKNSKTIPNVIEQAPYIPGKNTVVTAIPIKSKPGFVLSPYAPDKGMIDVTEFEPGTDVKDPYTGKIMRVPPLPETTKKSGPTITTLSETPNGSPSTPAQTDKKEAPSIEP